MNKSVSRVFAGAVVAGLLCGASAFAESTITTTTTSAAPAAAPHADAHKGTEHGSHHKKDKCSGSVKKEGAHKNNDHSAKKDHTNTPVTKK